jgi:hypothetical protein
MSSDFRTSERQRFENYVFKLRGGSGAPELRKKLRLVLSSALNDVLLRKNELKFHSFKNN